MDYHEETPDLFRNSTLGMYDVESEGDDEFYDAEDPVDAMMTGEDLSGASDDGDDDDDEDDDGDDDIDDMSSELSAIDSDLDGGDNADDIEMEIEVDPYDDERGSEDIDEDASDMEDIEIIDDLIWYHRLTVTMTVTMMMVAMMKKIAPLGMMMK